MSNRQLFCCYTFAFVNLKNSAKIDLNYTVTLCKDITSAVNICYIGCANIKKYSIVNEMD